jgi:excisionase family DNA binding protein
MEREHSFAGQAEGPRYWSEEEVAARLGVLPRTVRLWRRTRGLPFCRLTGKSVIFRPEDVDQWVAARRVAVTV